MQSLHWIGYIPDYSKISVMFFEFPNKFWRVCLVLYTTRLSYQVRILFRGFHSNGVWEQIKLSKFLWCSWWESLFNVQQTAPLCSTTTSGTITLLFAIVDADYCFRFIDVGGESHSSDSTIFRNFSLKIAMDKNLLNWPNREVSVRGDVFPLEAHLLKPYKEKFHFFVGQFFLARHNGNFNKNLLCI